MNWLAGLRRKWWTRRGGVVKPGTFVMDTEWHRSEELRPDRLGPDEYDIVDPERPSRTLGKF
jgi:hypothetical protein